LKGLVQAFHEHPDVVNCYRARVITFETDGLAIYSKWKKCESMKAKYSHFATGVSGVIYPPKLQAAIKAAGTEFQSCCPRADDIWLHAQAVRAKFKIRQFVPRALHFPILPGTQKNALQLTNVDTETAGNDRQAARTYKEADLRTILTAEATDLLPVGSCSLPANKLPEHDFLREVQP
jgi:hypothetical protein